MQYSKICVLLFLAGVSFTKGSNIVAPALAPAVVPNTLLPAPNVFRTSLFSPAFAPNVPSAVAPVVPRGLVPAAPAVAPAAFEPFPGSLVPAAYAAPSPWLPAPFAFQARSIHAVAPAAVPAAYPHAVPAAGPVLPPFPVALAR